MESKALDPDKTFPYLAWIHQLFQVITQKLEFSM